MIQRTITVAALRVADTDTVQSKPTSMTDEERNSGCYWTFGGASEDEQSIHHTYVLHSPDEAPTSTCNPSEADISRRVELLREACACSVAENPTDSDYAAIQWGKFYIVVVGKGTTTGNSYRVWADATSDVFERELRRVAIRQLLAERGGK
jgi:hypothetical protein